MSGRIWATAVFCSVFALLHCGGSVSVTGGSGGAAGHAGRGHAGSSGHANIAGASGAGAASSDAGLDVYVDPGCPDLGPPVSVNECDAYSPTPSCPPDQGCYPFVEQPFDTGCGAQRFGTECRAAGTGRQGDVCGGGQGGCATGFVCVVGAQPGKHCVQLCPVGSQHTCPAGLICGELDVEGFGVCS